MKRRNLLLWFFALLALVAVNVLVFQKERLKANGQLVLLELAPREQRSLFQGDYIGLRYAISKEVENDTDRRNGFVVVQLDANHVAQYKRVHDGHSPLAQGELLLPFRQRSWDTRVGPESFFFQEGQAEYYENARYGELRLSESGEVLLTGLRGPDLEVLGPS